MIVIENAVNEKAKFRKMFKGYNSIFVTLIPHGETVNIKFSSETVRGNHVEYNISAKREYNASLKHTIYLPFVDYNDCVFDLIFDKEGFYVETYKNNYQGVRVISDSGTEGYISTVIFKTRRKTTRFTAPCNPYSDMIK